MKKIKRISIILLLFLMALLFNANKVEAATNIPKVQNVKVSYKDDGRIYVTWDKVKSNLDIDYTLTYYKVEEDIPSWGYGTDDNSMYLSPACFDMGYNYYIRVRAKATGVGLGEFSNAVTVTPRLGKVNNVKYKSSTDSSITVSWSGVEKAKGYQVYVYTNATKKYNYYGKTSGTSITIKKLKAATSHRIKVRAYSTGNGKTQYGSYSNLLKTITKPKKVSKLTNSIQSNGIKLKWTKVSGATGYRIYRATSKNGSYSKLKTITKSSTTSYTDKSAKNGKRYYYKIKAYVTYFGSKYMSVGSNKSTRLFVSAPSVSIKCYNDKAKISWKKVSSASGYRIYRSTSKNGTYKKIKTITKGSTTSYTDKKIKSKKTYYYKVKAYKTKSGTKYHSAYSSAIQKTPYAQVTIKSSSDNAKKKSITIKWNKVSGVTGYKIYRSTTKYGTYKYIKTISKSKTTSYTDKKGLTVGKVYYYKIRAYKKSGKKTVYGQYSSPKKQTIGSRTQQLNRVTLKPTTSGYTDLDKEYKKIIKKVTKGKKTVYDKVKACYKYVEEKLSHKKGYNCKHFAGTFAGMMKVLGIRNVYCAEGKTTSTSGGWTAHTWVIIEVNGTRYIFDPSIDRHVKDSTKKTSYSRFFKTESELKNKYKLSYYNTFSFPTLISEGVYGVMWY